MPFGVGFDALRTNSPVISYTSMDAESLEADLVVYAQTQFHDRWTLFQNNEFAVSLLKQQVYIGDLLSYNYNMGLGEVSPMTAVRRKNFRNVAKAWGFSLRGPEASTVDMLVISDPALLPYLLEADSFRVRAVGDNIFMPTVTTLIVDAEQTVPFIAGDLQDNEVLGVSDGTADQSFELSESPLLEDTLAVTVGGVPWVVATQRATTKSTDEVFFLDVDDRTGTALIFFGDGVNGKVPSETAEIRATYKIGGGRASNIPPYGVVGVETIVEGLLSINNPLKANGGDNAMTLAQAKVALPADVNTNDRAVTLEDYSRLLFTSDAPGGIAKASATPGGVGRVFVWAAPNGGGALSDTQINENTEFLTELSTNTSVEIRDHTQIPVEAEFEVWVKKNYRPDDVVAKVRALLATEEPDPEVQNGLLDFDKVGLGGRDDEDEPQITVTKIQNLAKGLDSDGLQRLVIKTLRTIPQTKQPVFRDNAGNGTISDVVYPGVLVHRREFRVLFSSARDFTVYRRVVGTVSYLSDDRLVDTNLELGTTDDTPLPLPAGTTLNPNRDQTLIFSVDVALTTDNTIVKSASSAGSLFGASAPGKEYYLEILDGTGTVSGPPGTTEVYTSPIGDVEFTINLGDEDFTSGDYILFDVFPTVSDIITRPDELPVLLRDSSGLATNFVTKVRQ